MISAYRYSPIAIALLTLLGGFATAVGQSSVEVPFEFVHNQIVVKVAINGKGPFNAMIDTGTDPSAIDIKTAREIGIKLGSTAHKTSGGGTDANASYLCKISTLGVGAIAATDVDAAAIDLSRISERMGGPIGAILGYSFLNKRIVQLDYRRAVVRFLNRPPPGDTGANAVTRPFRYKNNVLIDDVLVNGKPVTANIDTGSSGTFQLSPRAVKELGLTEEAATGKTNTSVGYNGAYENHEGTIKNVTIGTISVENPLVLFLAKGTGHDRVPWSINIGNDFMKDYLVTIDYRAKIVTFASSEP